MTEGTPDNLTQVLLSKTCPPLGERLQAWHDKVLGSDSSCPPSLVTLVGCVTSPAQPQGFLPGDGAQGCGVVAMCRDKESKCFLMLERTLCETGEGAGCRLCSRCLGDTSEPKNETSLLVGLHSSGRETVNKKQNT